MSSDPFELLGLDRGTATDADVRRAYAEQLKVTRPDEDRNGFMALRTAFERARDEVRWRDEYGTYEDDGETDDSPYDDPETNSPGDQREPESDPEDSAPIPGMPPRLSLGDITDYVPASARPDAAPESAHQDDPDTDDAAETTADHETRANAAMDQLIDALTATGKPPALRELMAIIDHAEVGGIEEYQSLQWQVRQFLCDRTGFHLDPQVLRVPDWLTLEAFDALDQYYGWTRQPTTNTYVRRLNDWLARLRREMAGHPPAPAERQDVIPPASERGSQIWLWIGAGILLLQVVRFVAGAGG
jgi:hypothetical protein